MMSSLSPGATPRLHLRLRPHAPIGRLIKTGSAVVGLSAASSGAAARLRSGMLTGRTAGSSLRVIAAQRLFPLAPLVTCLGFLTYWGLRDHQ
jgi:hypothetical protein